MERVTRIPRKCHNFFFVNLLPCNLKSPVGFSHRGWNKCVLQLAPEAWSIQFLKKKFSPHHRTQHSAFKKKIKDEFPFSKQKSFALDMQQRTSSSQNLKIFRRKITSLRICRKTTYNLADLKMLFWKEKCTSTFTFDIRCPTFFFLVESVQSWERLFLFPPPSLSPTNLFVSSSPSDCQWRRRVTQFGRTQPTTPPQ